MAELERTGLLFETGWLHGVKLPADRTASAAPTASSWEVVTPEKAPTVTADAEDKTEKATVERWPQKGLREALTAAQQHLKPETGVLLALPTSLLLIRVLRLPPTDDANLGDMVRLQMEKVAPCSGDDLSVGYEVLAQEAEGVRVLGAAIPQERLDELAEITDAAGIRLTRIDAALLCWWHQLTTLKRREIDSGSALILLKQGTEWDLLLTQQGEIVQTRGLGNLPTAADLQREVVLSLLNHEMERAEFKVDGALVVAAAEPEREWLLAIDAALGGTTQSEWLPREQLGRPALGAARRKGESDRLDLIPDIWRRQERDVAQARKVQLGFVAASLLWLLLAGTLYALPKIAEQRNDTVKARISAGEERYRSVFEVRQRVRLIRSYMDRSQSSLEMLRELCTLMPQGVVFSSITYRRDDSFKLVGEAEQSARVYQLKDALDALDHYQSTRLTGPTLDGTRRRYRFDIDARFRGGAE